MLFLASLLYCLLCFVIPGELVLERVATHVPGLPFWLSLGLLNALVYLAILALVRLMGWAYTQIDLDHESKSQVVREWLRISGGQWIGSVGLAMIVLAAVFLVVAGRLPIQSVYLIAAVVIGLTDVAGRDFLLPVPSDLPDPRFDMEKLRESARPVGKTARFRWPPPTVTAGLRNGTFEIEIPVDDKEVNQAKVIASSKKPEDFDLVAHVREGFTPSVQWGALALRALSQRSTLSAVEEVLNVVAFVRSLECHDKSDTAVPKLPVHTLSDAGGSSRDLAILAIALLHLLGHDVALFLVPDETGEHMAIGYHTNQILSLCSARSADGREYTYLETTPRCGSGWVGNVGIALLARTAGVRVLPIT